MALSGEQPALRTALREMGAGDEEIARAVADGTLVLLAIEKLIRPASATFTLEEVAEQASLEPDLVLDLWRSLGYPEPQPGEVAFTESDAEILAEVGAPIATDDEVIERVLHVTRVIGSSMARIASAQVDTISGPGAAAEGGPGRATADEEVARRFGALLPVVPRVLEGAWRRHLQAAARRRMIAVAGDQAPEAVVGFADLVGFTALSQQMSDSELAGIVAEFENLVFDVITAAGGRVVKMIGDEVMFTVSSPKAGAETALSLVEGTRASDELSDVRVGMAYGPVMERESDLYGPVVNMASRVTVIALPGTVVVGPGVADRLRGDDAYVLRAMRPRYLKDIGRVPLHVLRRSHPVPGQFAHRRQALRDAVRARLDPR